MSLAAEGDLAVLAERLLSLPPSVRERFVLERNEADLAVIERALAERVAIGWRADPMSMAAHLSRGQIKAWRYARLLGQKFRDAVEGRSTRQIWNLPARLGKPVQVDELVLMADGSRRRLGDVEVGDLVITHRGRARPVLAVHDQGVLPIVQVTTRRGRIVRAAPDHPFLTAGGWVPAGDLRPARPRLLGDVLAAVAFPALTGETAARGEEFRIAGYLIGDGNVTAMGSSFGCNITCFDPIEGSDIEHCAEALGWRVSLQQSRGRYALRAGAGGRDAGPRTWLRSSGIAGATSHTKRVPAWVLTAPAAAAAEFIGAYFACDGTVTAGSAGRGQAVEFYSMSRLLLADVQHLLIRLGVSSTLASKYATHTNFTDGPVLSWRLTVVGADSIARFVETVRPRSIKAEQLQRLDVRRQTFDQPLLPDPVVSVEDAGVAECRCLTVEEDSSFTICDLAVHNSTVASKWGPAWALDRDPATKILLVSYGDHLAVENAIAVRDILREHAGELRAQLRRDRQQQDRFVTTEGGGVLAAGILASMTGFGADGAIIDDPFKDWQEAHSQGRRDLVYNQYRAVVRLRLETASSYVICCHTRWHEDDLTGRLLRDMEDHTGESWELVRIPAIAEAPDPGSTDLLRRLPDPLGREVGEVIEPERFDAEAVAQRHLALGSYLSAGLEQQRPAPEEGGEIKRAWWRLEDALPAKADQFLSSWDCKLKDKETGDYVVGQVWARTGKDCWLMDQIRGQFNFATTVNAVALMQVRWPACSRHIVENAGNGPEVMQALKSSAIGYEMSEEMAGQLGMTADEIPKVQALRRRGMAGLLPNPPKGSKVARARAVAPYIEAGDVHLPAHATWLGAYLDEHAGFPNGTHDDQVDATSQALAHMHHLGQRTGRKLMGQVTAELGL